MTPPVNRACYNTKSQRQERIYMLPVVLGAVALGAVGYGIKKCLEDEKFIKKGVKKYDDIVDKVKSYEARDYSQEKDERKTKAEQEPSKT